MYIMVMHNDTKNLITIVQFVFSNLLFQILHLYTGLFFQGKKLSINTTMLYYAHTVNCWYIEEYNKQVYKYFGIMLNVPSYNIICNYLQLIYKINIALHRSQIVNYVASYQYAQTLYSYKLYYTNQKCNECMKRRGAF